MTFGKLTEYFEKLEETSSRLSLIEILSQLFKEVDEKDIAKVAYLIQGRVAPFYEPVEIGMAEKSVAAAIAKAYGLSREEVLAEYGRVGDLGKVALELAKKAHVKEQNQSIAEVFKVLTEIAHISGEGTVEKRLNLLVDLLSKVDPISAKHLVRIPLGTSRLGIGDPTVLDGFATAKLGDKSKRKLLEGAYNKVSDLGLIGETLWKSGLKGVEKLDVMVGRPLRSQLAERLPTPEKVIEKFEGKAHVQYKYDGFRCVGGFTPIYVKDKGITSMRDLRVGDKVLTKSGSFKTVLAKNKRTIKKNEKLFKFQTYLGESIKVSEGHPILTFKDGQEKWVNIENITAGDEVIFPIPQFPPNNPHPAPEKLDLQTISGYKKTFQLNESFYRFLGFWIGDGFTNDYHNTERVGLLFNGKTEVGLASFYKKIVTETLFIPKISISKTAAKGCLTLYWRDEPLKHWLSTYFRREWVGKMLPEWFVHVSKKNFQQFLQGWIESDGSVDKDGVTKIITKERDLAALAQLIALSHGIVIGLHYIRIKKALKGAIDKTYYQLVIPKTTRKAYIKDNKLLVKVLRNEEIKRRDSRIQLYDIQVQDEESFCAPMVTLHNCQIHKMDKKVRLFSRNLEETTLMFPDLIQGVLNQIKAKSVILDSEALAFNPESEEFLPFQETTKRRRKYDIAEMAKKLPLRAFVFDIMYLNGRSLVDLPLAERIKLLKETIRGDEVLIPQPGEITSDAKRVETLFDDALTKGLEGLIVKRPDSKYEAGARNFNWVKLKRHSNGELKDTIDCVILGYIFGRGKRAAFGAGALLVGVYDKAKDEFVTVSKIGTGLTDDEWREIHKRADKIKVDKKPARVNSLLVPSVWIKPEIVIEVLADEITKSPTHTAGKDESGVGYALRFPRLVKFREKDKTAEDATTVKELVEMYEQQYSKK
ncbi:ATP-dependent DNA ligase [Candidatus Daviesbacteria bacterium]|nr:ATP-dependent DNA ligase [Candidatus Daviesbacteria bacterium]